MTVPVRALSRVKSARPSYGQWRCRDISDRCPIVCSGLAIAIIFFFCSSRVAGRIDHRILPIINPQIPVMVNYAFPFSLPPSTIIEAWEHHETIK